MIDEVKYMGKRARTAEGYTCAAWNDQSVHKHNYLNKIGHNFCRNPDRSKTGPWCYTTDPNKKWDDCSVTTCCEPENEFRHDQAFCGQRPSMNDTAVRVVGGRSAIARCC